MCRNRFGRVIFIILAMGLAWGPLAAQEQLLTFEELSNADRSHLQAFHDGRNPLTPADDAVLEKAAKFYVYRLTNPLFQKSSLDGQPNLRNMQYLVQDATRQLAVPETGRALNANQVKYNQQLAKVYVGRIKDVLKTNNIARINAARLLAVLAKTGSEDVGEALAGILEDKAQIDAVKFEAVVAFEELFRTTQPAKPALEARWIKDIADFVTRKPNLAADATAAEVDAFRYVRRKAVAALAQTRRPGVANGNQIEVPTALILVRVLRKEGISPEPDVREQVEAAIGLCQLQSKLLPDYQPDYAAFQIGRFLTEFAVKREDDRLKNESKGQPWRILAAKQQQALARMKVDTGSKYVSDLADLGNVLLRNIVTNTAANPTGLDNWLGQNKPAAKSLYKSDPNATLKTAAKDG